MRDRHKRLPAILIALLFVGEGLVLGVFLHRQGVENRQLEGELKAEKEVVAGMEKEAVAMEAEVGALKEEIEALLHPKNSVSYHGGLSVEEGRLVDQHGEPIQLRGASSHGIMWYPQYGNYRAILSTKERGANLFRIAMYTDEEFGYVENPEEAERTLRITLENVLGADMYAIVDWHVLREENPNTYADEAVKFFDRISRLYADEPGVIYEICNEPNGDTTWQEIKAYAERVIPAIRANAPEAVVLVGTPRYSSDLEEAVEDPLEFENVMYAHHYYAEQSGDGYQYQIDEALENGCGVFVSEWGIGDMEDADETEELLGRCADFLDYLDANGVSWAGWALADKEEGHSMIVPGGSRWSGWGEENLTPYGRFVFERLGGGA